MVATVNQHGPGALAVSERGSAIRKTLKGGTKRALAPGRTLGLGKAGENLPEVGDITNDTADLTIKGNLREQRRDPWRWANALPKAAADPVPKGEDADRRSQTCLDLVREPVAQPPVQAS